MKITISGEHNGKSKTIATLEYTPEIVKGDPVNVEEEIFTAIRQQMKYYIERVVKQ